MAFALGPRAPEDRYRLASFETIGSTSAECTARARAGDPGRLWVVASEQTSGHGRRGRPWQTPRGNLAASLLAPAPPYAAVTATLGFAAGLAIHHAISVACAVPPPRGAEPGRLRLKWPNDVLLDGAKVAGILLEAVEQPGRQRAVVVGIGVNVSQAPRDLPYPATSLVESGLETTAEALFFALTDAWVEQEALWSAGRGFQAVRDRWLTRAAGLGAPVSVRLGNDVLRGTFETIDPDGRLVMRNPDGSARAVSAGDVYFGTAATAI
jgi:BirA family transcriptional regulator, biotin operon repressor / biotin---[acetyl-CoA-carboxylase] ligase